MKSKYIDQYGLYKHVEHFGGKSVLDFMSNIIETLDVGNLISKEENASKIPYAKEIGQRLIRKIIPTVSPRLFRIKRKIFCPGCS